MATLLQDDYNRTANATAVGSPVVGGPYTVRAGVWGVTGTSLYTSAATTNSILTFPAAINVDFQAVISASTANGIVVRWIDASNYWLLQATGLFHMLGGVFYTRSPNPALAVPFTARLVTQGPLITAYLNNLPYTEVEDESYAVATATSGFRSNNSTVGRFDDAIAIDSTALSTPAGGVLPDENYAGVASEREAWVAKGRDRYSLDLAGVA